MQISTKVEYGLLALLELAMHYYQNKTLGTPEIAERQNIPERYLDQILAELRRAGITKSYRGAKGGYTLARSPMDISLLDIVNALEGLSDKDQANASKSTLEQRIVKATLRSAVADMEKVLLKTLLENLYQERLLQEEPPLMYYI